MRFELTKEYLEKIEVAIERQDNEWLINTLKELHDADIASIIDELEFEDGAYLFELLDDETQGDVLVEIDDDVRDHIISTYSSKEIAEQIENLDSDDAADIIADLPKNQIAEVISHIQDNEAAEDIVDLLNYAEDSAGGLMQKEFIRAKLDWPVNRCIIELRRQAEDVEKVYTIYVVDDEDRLVGLLSLKSLLFASQKTKISDLYVNKNMKILDELYGDRDDFGIASFTIEALFSANSKRISEICSDKLFNSD